MERSRLAGDPEMGQKLLRSIFSDAIILGGLTLFGYLATYAYLCGNADVLGIPQELVSVSLEKCLVTILILLGVLLACMFVIDVAASVVPKILRESPLIVSLTIVASLVVGTLFLGLIASPKLFWLGMLPALILIRILTWPLVQKDRAGTYFERIKRLRIRSNSTTNRWFIARTGVSAIVLASILAFPLAACYAIGYADGIYRLSYFATPEKNPEVLLARYGEVFVFRRKGNASIIVRLLGKDEFSPLVWRGTGSMAVKHHVDMFYMYETR